MSDEQDEQAPDVEPDAVTPPDESGEHGNELAGSGGVAGTGERGAGVGGGGGPSRVI